MTDDDQQLRGRLRAVDPAASLRPADPAWAARLVEDTMSDNLAPEVPETRQTGVHDRSRLTWLVAAAAVVLIAGVTVFVLVERGGDDIPAASDDSSDTLVDDESASGEPGAEPTVTTLTVPATVGSVRCAVPSVDVLARQSLAFDGTVDDITNGIVTLTPTMFYAGEPTDRVQVQAPPEVLRQLILAVEFEVGQRYLVSASGGEVSVCGYSAAWSPSLEQMYVEAFPG